MKQSKSIEKNNLKNICVKSEIGKLKRVLIHSPDGGIGKIIPSKFSDWLYDDIIHLGKMQKEYDEFVRVLLYFLDPEKITYIKEQEEKLKNPIQRANCFKPDKKEYFNSNMILDAQKILSDILEKETPDGKLNTVRLKLISAICAIEGCNYEIEKKLEKLSGTALSKVFITGVIPKRNGVKPDEFIFPPIPNFIFTRDLGVVINDHLLLSKTAKLARKRETILTKFIALYSLFRSNPEKIIEITEDSNYFLLEENEQKEKIITIEGGDIMMISSKHLIVGCSERTSSNAINSIIHKIFSNKNLGIEIISIIKVPKKRSSMHIDTIFTQIDRKTWIVYGYFSEKIKKENEQKYKSYLPSLMHEKERIELEDLEILQFYKRLDEEYKKNKDFQRVKNKTPQGLEKLLINISTVDFNCRLSEIKIIYCANHEFPHYQREQWTDACNLLAVKEGVVIGYDRNEITTKVFKENLGFHVIKAKCLFEKFDKGELSPDNLEKTLILLSSSELSRARGGSHCMSLPILREDWKK